MNVFYLAQVYASRLNGKRLNVFLKDSIAIEKNFRNKSNTINTKQVRLKRKRKSINNVLHIFSSHICVNVLNNGHDR